MSDSPEPTGLDPEAAIKGHLGHARAAQEAQEAEHAAEVEELLRHPPPPVIDTRRYQRMIGLFGLLLVVAFSIYLFVNGGSGTPGIAPGQHLHKFVAPLATSNLNVGANANPVCNRARPARRGLNVCGRKPIVLSFFALGAKPCVHEVDVLQQIAARFPKVQFAAVAVNAGRKATAALVRQQHWTIPIAYDETGVVGQIYGVEVCPLVEIARGNGVIARRLIGEHWLSATNLAGVVTKLGL